MKIVFNVKKEFADKIPPFLFVGRIGQMSS